jgi:ribose/xylose/arabinose/galactoside ABC-type transport system permease subunit
MSPPPGFATAPPRQPHPRLSARGRELVGLAPFVGVSLLLLVIAQIVAVVVLPSGGFGDTLRSTIMGVTARALFACALALTLHARSLDVSIFGTAALCGVVFAAIGGVVGLVVTLAVALVVGVVNAALVGLLRLHSVAATLGTGALMFGVALVATHGGSLTLKHLLPAAIGTVVLVLLVLLAIGLDVLHLFVRVGERVPEPLRRSLSHVAAALLVGVGAVVEAVLLRSAAPGGVGMELLLAAFAAAFLGGTSASGRGRSLVGVVIAAAFLTSISLTVGFVGRSPYIYYVVVGVLLVLAVGGDRLRDLLLTPKASTPAHPAHPAK